MTKTAKDILILSLLTVTSTLLVWLPFMLSPTGMLRVFANYDGPNYMIVAKSLYNPEIIKSTFSLPLPIEYHPAHFPGYPLLIRTLSFAVPTTWAMLIVTVMTTITAVTAFYFFVRRFNLTSSPLWLSILFLFLPARWLVIRTIGSPEPLFLTAIIASFFFFHQSHVLKNFLLAAFFGVIAQITKTPGILLFASYTLYLSIEVIKSHKIPWKSFPLLLIPLSVLPIFTYYKLQTGDFWAYFHSGDNFHLVFPPFQSFVIERSWLGDFWLEDLIYIYLLGALTVVLLFKRKLYDLATFAAIFFLATLFVAHRDLSRYSLPLMPFSLIAFAPFLERKEFKFVFALILIPIYLYTINFITHNTAPIADWTPYF